MQNTTVVTQPNLFPQAYHTRTLTRTNALSKLVAETPKLQGATTASTFFRDKLSDKAQSEPMGTKSHAVDLNIKIRDIPMSVLNEKANDVPKLTKMQTAEKYLGLVGKVLKKIPTAIENWAKTTDYMVGNRYIESGHKLMKSEYAGYQKLLAAANAPDLELWQAQKVTATKDKARLIEKLKQNDPPLSEEAITQIDQERFELDARILTLDAKINKVTHLQSLAAQTKTKAENAIALGEAIKGGKAELAEKYGSNNILKTAKLGTKAIKTVNKVAMMDEIVHHPEQIKASVDVTQGINSMVQGKKELMEQARHGASVAIGISEPALEVISAVGAGLSLVTNGRTLYKTGQSYNVQLDRVEMARALTMPDGDVGRENMALALEAQATKLENSLTSRIGATLNPFEKTSNPAVLRAKAAAIRTLNNQALTPDTLDPAVKALATQIKERADLDIKRKTMIRSSLAMAVGALGVATIAMGPLAPAALGTILTIAGAGLAVYGGVILCKRGLLAFQRFRDNKFLENNQEQIDLRKDRLHSERSQIQDQIALEKPKADLAAQPLRDTRNGLLTQLQSLKSERTSLAEQRVFACEKAILIERLAKHPEERPTPEEITKYNLNPDSNWSEILPAADRAIGEIDTKVRDLNSESSSLEGKIDDLGSKINELYNEYNNLAMTGNEITSNLDRLNTLSIDNTIQLLAASPKQAAPIIAKGVLSGDPSMTYIAQAILQIDVRNLPADVAESEVSRRLQGKLSPDVGSPPLTSQSQGGQTTQSPAPSPNNNSDNFNFVPEEFIANVGRPVHTMRAQIEV